MALAVEPQRSASDGRVLPRPEPSVVALWIDSSLSPERRAALERLVRAELAAHDVTLEVTAGRPPLAEWVLEVHRDQRVLLGAALDADESGWKFYVTHVAKGLSMERRLPGGADADAAALEAVATILDSAISALREGLELGEQATAADERAQPVRAERAPAPTGAHDDDTAEREAETGDSPGVLGSVGATAAGVGDTLVAGGNASLGLGLGRHFAARAGGALYFPKRVETEYGAFRFQRSVFDLRAEAPFSARPFDLAPELGVVLEVVRRSGAAPEPGVAATPAASHLRGGVLLGLRGRYPLGDFVALELGVHVEGYTRSLHFLARDTPGVEIFTLGPLMLAADLGVTVGRR